MKLIIGNQNYSSWSMRPWVFVKYHDLNIEIEKISLFTASTKKIMSGHFSNNKVPLLIDGGLEVWDSLAILECLAEMFPATMGWPENFEARAVARSVSAEMHSSFAALRNALPMNCRRFFPDYSLGPDALRDIDRIRAIWNRCRQNYGQAGPWLFGKFSIADAMYAPIVMRFRSVAVDLDSVSQAYFDTMHKSKAVKLWLREGKSEDEILKEDELNWPSKPID